MDRNWKVGVLMGGDSSERAISLKSGNAVFNALSAAGIQVCALDIVSHKSEDNKDLIANAGIDVAFIALHGRYGEDGGIQSLLEEMGFPYVGSDAQASRLAMDKAQTQIRLQHNDIRVPDFFVLKKNDSYDKQKIFDSLGGKCVIKPSREGSSVGISIIENLSQWDAAVDKAFSLGETALVERCIQGREMTVGILDNAALPVVEICPQDQFFNFQAKYEKGRTRYCVPAQLPEIATCLVQSIAQKTFEVLGCRDIGRVDFIMDGDGNFYVLEMNTIPGFTETSLLPMAAAEAGKSFTDICLMLVDMAGQRR